MRLEKKVFISYAWHNKNEVELIDKDFRDFGIVLTRDIRDLNYRESIKEYMQKIKYTDYALVIVSDAFLKSPNCMYEVMELLQLEDFENRILPIILNCAKIYNPIDRSSYINFGEIKLNEIETKLRHQKSISYSDSILNEINKYKKIRDSVDKFIDHLNSHLHYSLDEVKKMDYLPIKKILEIVSDDQPIEMSNREKNAYLNGIEVERKRIAEELHDNLGSIISTISLHLNSIDNNNIPSDSINAVKELTRELYSDIRLFTYELFPAGLGFYGLINSINILIERINNPNLSIQYKNSVPEFHFDRDAELKVYRIIQELVSNVMKHSNASKCIVETKLIDDKFTLEVRDDGVGFNPSNIGGIYKQGLKNINARIGSLNGVITIDSEKGTGTSVFISIPINQLKK